MKCNAPHVSTYRQTKISSHQEGHASVSRVSTGVFDCSRILALLVVMSISHAESPLESPASSLMETFVISGYSETKSSPVLPTDPFKPYGRDVLLRKPYAGCIERGSQARQSIWGERGGPCQERGRERRRISCCRGGGGEDRSAHVENEGEGDRVSYVESKRGGGEVFM